jgi:uracil phosphoribosyltransferase/phosphoserine phosphatase/adenylate kinase
VLTPKIAMESAANMSTATETRPCSKKPTVIGLYGVPGSGKTFLLEQLKQELGQERFAFYEGSDVIGDLVSGGLEEFQNLPEVEKVLWRERAIDAIAKDCNESGRAAIVTGHFMFWPETDEAGCSVCTRNDLETFTHIVYLNVPEEVVLQRCRGDPTRTRATVSATHVSKWQQAERTQLRDLCLNHGILFSLVSRHSPMLRHLSMLLNDFQVHDEEHNLALAEGMLDDMFFAQQGRLKTLLVLDADRTLATVDTGLLFWTKTATEHTMNDNNPLKKLFSSPLGYSYVAFRQATLLYEEVANDKEFDAICQEVAKEVVIHPEFVTLLKLVEKNQQAGAVIVSCGLRRVWEIVLERAGLSQAVRFVGGGRIADGLVVTAAVKAALVARLQAVYQAYVWAFGDSPLDLEMLIQADQAIVVAGDKATRSKTMDAALATAINDRSLCARQALLPTNSSPRLDISKLPLVQLTDSTFIEAVLNQHAAVRLVHATSRSAAKLLMTPMRNANLAGPALREAHRQVGRYLATEFLPDVMGLEEYVIPHVQGHETSGYRVLKEQQTLIVALMRGGEPMALGVNEALPNAAFLHARIPQDIKDYHVHGQHSVVLVDSVVNSGKTVANFVQRIRTLHEAIHIVVVAGVVQAQSTSNGSLGQLAHDNLSFVALRMSENKFTGRGTTDTGNRLFNTTHLD